jgi:hypothetical protein
MSVIRLLLIVMFIALVGCAPTVRKPIIEPAVREQPKIIEDDIIEPGPRVENQRPEDQHSSKLPEPGAGDAAVEQPSSDQQENRTVEPFKRKTRTYKYRPKRPSGKKLEETTGNEEREP